MKMIRLVSALLVLVVALHANEKKFDKNHAYYIEPKLTYTLGETVYHNGAELRGAEGIGLGFDIGYVFSKLFGLEIDGTFSRSKVQEIDASGHIKEDNAMFYTYGLNSVWTHHVSHDFILLAKLGYGVEHEDLGSLNIKGSKHGTTWAAGLEYEHNEHVEVTLEFEGADIRSVRGDSIQLGIVYKY